MTTLRREAIRKVKDVLIFDAVFCSDGLELESPYKEQYQELAERIVDSVLSLPAFPIRALQSEEPPFSIEEADIAWIIKSGATVTKKYVNKQKEAFEWETLIDAQLTRLNMNWRQHDEKEKDRFRRFLKDERKLGRELETWVNWWMSDEWQVAHMPWKLSTLREQWLKAFPIAEKSTRPEYQKFEAPPEEEFISNPKAKK